MVRDPLGPDPVRSVVETGGHVNVPAVFLDALGVSEGDSVVLTLEGDEVRLCGPDAAIRRVQRLVARYVPADVSLADELIADGGERPRCGRPRAAADCLSAIVPVWHWRCPPACRC